MSRLSPSISAISYFLPERVVTNEELSIDSKWTPDGITAKTGIKKRHVADLSQTAADMAVEAAKKIVDVHVPAREIDLLVFCTQSPDYVLPTSACIIQERLGLPTSCAAFDFNLGCSGYVYGLSIVKSMLESGIASKALLLTGETYSRWMDDEDLSVRTIFGDAGSATLVEMSPSGSIGPFVLGTDGSGAHHLILHGHAARCKAGDPLFSRFPGGRVPDKLFMDGPEIYVFTLECVPEVFRDLLEKANVLMDELDYVILHQANTYMLEQLRKQCAIPEEKFLIDIEEYGNTVSNTIPIVLANLAEQSKLYSGMKIALVGFGVGLSWGACLVDWK